jgi:hypothetical protein
VSARYEASSKGIYVEVDDEPAPRAGVASKSSRHAVAAVQAVADGRGSAVYAEGHSTLTGAPAVLVRGHGELLRLERWNGTRYVTSATIDSAGTLDVEDITVQGQAIEGAGPQPVSFGIACSDETTAITSGNGKATFRLPHAMTLTAVRASLTTASSSGLVTVDINEGGSTILSTKLTIDQGEKTSTTAATAAVISDASLADDAEITADIDGAGTNAAGLKVWLIGTRAV